MHSHTPNTAVRCTAKQGCRKTCLQNVVLGAHAQLVEDAVCSGSPPEHLTHGTTLPESCIQQGQAQIAHQWQ